MELISDDWVLWIVNRSCMVLVACTNLSQLNFLFIWEYFKVALNNFEYFPRLRFWWVIITTIDWLMPKSEALKTSGAVKTQQGFIVDTNRERESKTKGNWIMIEFFKKMNLKLTFTCQRETPLELESWKTISLSPFPSKNKYRHLTTLVNASWFYSSKGDPLRFKGLKLPSAIL